MELDEKQQQYLQLVAKYPNLIYLIYHISSNLIHSLNHTVFSIILNVLYLDISIFYILIKKNLLNYDNVFLPLLFTFVY